MSEPAVGIPCSGPPGSRCARSWRRDGVRIGSGGLFGPITTPAGVVPGFDRSKWTTGTPRERLGLLPAAQEHILRQENGKDRCLRAVRELSQAFALAVPHNEALRIRDDVAFFQTVQAVLAKRVPGEARPDEDLDHAVRQIISRAVASEGVVDIFAAAGLQKPDISILSDEFLSEVRGMPQRNLAVELFQKLLKGELGARRRRRWSRPAPSPRCWSRPSGGTRTVPSRRRR